jgi:hypothetical protein
VRNGAPLESDHTCKSCTSLTPSSLRGRMVQGGGGQGGVKKNTMWRPYAPHKNSD